MEQTQGTGSEPYGGTAPQPMAAAPPPPRKTDVAKPALVVAVIALALALVGMVAFPGPEGPEGVPGLEGDEGPEGDTGPRGNDGPQGPSGADGIACWDLNGNGAGDLPAEDINGDLVVDVLDCTGAQGLQGIQGLQGPQGLQGDPGPQGLQGLPGTPATVLWAVVESNGTLARGSNVVSSTYEGTGDYTVRFNQDVRACVYVASLGFTGFVGVPPPGSVTVVGEFADPTGVWVSTDDISGTATDRSFHLAVFC